MAQPKVGFRRNERHHLKAILIDVRLGWSPSRRFEHFRRLTAQLPSAMPSRRFPKPWTVEPMPSGYQIIDANGMVLAHVYGRPNGAIAGADIRLTNDEARRVAKLIARLPELVEMEQDRNRPRSVASRCRSASSR